MRLLKWQSDGELSLTKDLTENIPSYAVLSHTWGADDDEVNFNDLKTKTWQNKTGYKKIRFCGQQAQKDGLHYMWIDTCCIDKANHSELSEALISMFHWYRDAAKCYVYLSDVSVSLREDGTLNTGWQSDFIRSRWFLRGWTLQELLAPTIVEFFSCKGYPLGDRNCLEQLIQQTTQIPLTALRGSSLSSFSITERLRWAAKRQTKKKEDRAYCLFGIFGVYLPILYGEGDNAFIRLEEEILKSLSRSLNHGVHQSTTFREHLPISENLPFLTDARPDPYNQRQAESISRDEIGPSNRLRLSTDRSALQAGLNEKPTLAASDQLHNSAVGRFPTNGTARVVNRSGSMSLRAQLPHPAIEDIEKVVRDVLDGYLHECEQELVQLSQCRFRGWVADNVKPLLESPLKSMLTEMQAAILHSESIQGDRMRNSNLIKNLDASEHEGGSAQDPQTFESFQGKDETTSPCCATLHCETRTIARGNRLGFLVLRFQSIGDWLHVFFIFQPTRFISRGLDISYEISFDGRGFPRIRNGGLDFYGILPEDSCINDLISEGNRQGLHDALLNREVSVKDRFAKYGETLLHLAAGVGKSQLCIDLIKWGADVSAVDRNGYTPLNYLVRVLFKLAMDHLTTIGPSMRDNGVLIINEFQKYHTFSQLAEEAADGFLSVAVGSFRGQNELESMQFAVTWLKILCSEGVNLTQRHANGQPGIVAWMCLVAGNLIGTLSSEDAEVSSRFLSSLNNTLSWMVIILSSGIDASQSDPDGSNALHGWFILHHNALAQFLKKGGTLSPSTLDHFLDYCNEGLTILCCFGANIYAADSSGRYPQDYAEHMGCDSILENVLWFCGYVNDPDTGFPVSRSQTSAVHISSPDSSHDGIIRRRHAFVYDNWSENTHIVEDKPESSKSYRIPSEIEEAVSRLPLAGKLRFHRNCSRTCHQRLMQEWTPRARDILLGRHLAATGALYGSPVHQWYAQWDWETLSVRQNTTTGKTASTK